MLFRTHIVFSIFVGLILLNLFQIGLFDKCLFFGFVLLATIFVDIDSHKSYIGNHWFFRPLQLFVRHRGRLHSLLFGVLFSVIVASFYMWAGVGFFVGYLSHLFLDLLTRQGVSLFWPLFSKNISFGIKSGGVIEDIFFVLFLLGDVFWLGVLLGVFG